MLTEIANKVAGHILKHLTVEAVHVIVLIPQHTQVLQRNVQLSNQYFTLSSTIELLLYLDTL